jgi:hypothetical protein
MPETKERRDYVQIELKIFTNKNNSSNRDNNKPNTPKLVLPAGIS